MVALLILAWLGMATLVREFGWSLQAFVPAATALTAAVALIVGVSTIRQKSHNDRREQWWKRVQWALDKATSDSDAEQGVAFAALTEMLKDDTATRADATMLVATVRSLGVLSHLLPDSDITVADMAESLITEDAPLSPGLLTMTELFPSAKTPEESVGDVTDNADGMEH